jgi:hypothetical protein
MDLSISSLSLWERPNAKPAGVAIFIPFYKFADGSEYEFFFEQGVDFLKMPLNYSEHHLCLQVFPFPITHYAVADFLLLTHLDNMRQPFYNGKIASKTSS